MKYAKQKRQMQPGCLPSMHHMWNITAITFEYEVPTLEEFTDRIRQTKTKYPYLVAKQDGKVLGYAYAGQFHAREAYAWAVETSIYEMKLQAYGIGGH